MRGHTVRTAIALGALASLAAATGPVAASARTDSRAAAPPPVLVDCFWHAKVRPANFVLACGDGNSRLVSLHWSRWDTRSAVADGVNMVNDCKPYCAAGRFHAYAVVVRLDHPRTWKKDPHLRHYTRMTLTYKNAHPERLAQSVTYPLWN
ncbi:hypothetical protein JS756_00305 [Streptomyces actuosus]|uniref:Secreted protein n=1 Tax=Streptomyces actuosus TaxID=1885 RepID=A0ABS2VHK5_STRAS|nr:hypothetical protein [Streptomyces actuosus]MBN0042575.1 hypothetical protein [Streptomyces actuosus]